MRHNFDIETCSFGCNIRRIVGKPVKHNPVPWLSCRMHDSKFGFPCSICNSCLVTAEKFGKSLVYEVINRRLFYLVQNPSTEITD
jgi:hypothetical protein